MSTNRSASLKGLDATLRCMPFYEHRLLKVLATASPRSSPELAVYNFLAGQLQVKNVPDELLVQVCNTTISLMTQKYSECPSPAHLRQLIAESIIRCRTGRTSLQLYEAAKIFYSMPPRDEATASSWEVTIIYTTITAMTHERFMNAISPDDWREVLYDVVLGKIQQRKFEIKTTKQLPPRRHYDFSNLLKK